MGYNQPGVHEAVHHGGAGQCKWHSFPCRLFLPQICTTMTKADALESCLEGGGANRQKDLKLS
jgi:hypothetical protein